MADRSWRPHEPTTLEDRIREIVTEAVHEAITQRADDLHSDAPLTVSVAEASRMLGVSATTVRRLIENGRLPSVDFGPTARVKIPYGALEAFAVGKEWDPITNVPKKRD